VPELPRFEAAGRPGLDDATVVGPHFVENAGESTGGPDVERRAALARVLDETPPGRTSVEDGEPAQKLGASRVTKHPLLVGFEEVNRARPVMAASAARHAIGPVGIGGTFDGSHAPMGQLARASAGATLASSLRTMAAVGRFDGS
jgi:hypothetical protein